MNDDYALPPMPGWVAALIILLVAFGAWLQQQARTRTLNQEDYSSLTPHEFETHVRDVFRSLPGWTANVTKRSHDMGLDVLATAPDGERWAVQVKHYRAGGTPGIAAVQEAYFAQGFYGCDRALVVISKPQFTRPAQLGAAKVGVALWTGEDLRRLQRALQARGPLPAELFTA